MNWLGRFLSGSYDLGFYTLILLVGLAGFGLGLMGQHPQSVIFGVVCGALVTAGCCGFAVFVRDHLD